MAHLVVDSTVWVAAFPPKDKFHSEGLRFVQEIDAELHRCYASFLVLVETCAALMRQVPKKRKALALVMEARRRFRQWTDRGLLHWYALDEASAKQAVEFNVNLSRPLKGADAVVASVAGYLRHPLKTFDTEILQRYPDAAP